MKSPAELFSTLKTYIFKKYGENPGTMLVHTGALGWILSSMAQVTAVVVNDKISPEQKSFLIPQEIADAFINIVSFYVITSSFKNLASKLVSSGKLTTKSIKNFLEKEGVAEKLGKLNFNIEKLENFKDIKGEYKPFKNGVDVLASTIGSIISCNYVTPVLRNRFAAHEQKYAIAKMNSKNPTQTPTTPRTSMDTFINHSATRFSSGSLKI